jgi:uncharacterized protein
VRWRETTVKRDSGLARAGRFDAFRMAAEGDTLAGEFDASTLARVVDRLAPGAGPAPIAWRIAGDHDAFQRPMLSVTIEGSLPLQCQRCLQPFATAIAQQTGLLLAHDETELGLLDAEEAEVVLAAAPLDARTLVEDEVLLSLPFAPRHAEGQCPEGAGSVGGSNRYPPHVAVCAAGRAEEARIAQHLRSN